MKLKLPLLILGEETKDGRTCVPEGSFTMHTGEVPALRMVDGASQLVGKLTSVYREGRLIMGNVFISTPYLQVGHDLRDRKLYASASMNYVDYNVRDSHFYALTGTILAVAVMDIGLWPWEEYP